MMQPVYVGLGSNLGNRAAYVRRAASQLAVHPGIQLIQASCLYETEPVGLQPDATTASWFLNAVLELATDLTPTEFLAVCQAIEQDAGRQRLDLQPLESGYAPRTLDVDLLFFGADIVQSDGLIIPHPRMHERAFVLVPMLELAPDWEHPVLKKTIRQLHWALAAPEAVQLFDWLFPEP